MKKIILFLITLVIILLTIGSIFCLSNHEIKKLDRDTDGNPETTQYIWKKNIYKETIDFDLDGKIDFWIFWDKDGDIKKSIELQEGGSYDKDKSKRPYKLKSITFYKPGKIIRKNGQELRVQERDKEVRMVGLKKKAGPMVGDKMLVYTKDKKWVCSELFEEGVCFLRTYYGNSIPVLTKTEVDSNEDGKVDKWFYYEKRELSRIEKDTDYDGTIDEVETPSNSENK